MVDFDEWPTGPPSIEVRNAMDYHVVQVQWLAVYLYGTGQQTREIVDIARKNILYQIQILCREQTLKKEIILKGQESQRQPLHPASYLSCLVLYTYPL